MRQIVQVREAWALRAVGQRCTGDTTRHTLGKDDDKLPNTYIIVIIRIIDSSESKMNYGGAWEANEGSGLNPGVFGVRGENGAN